jgi:hypothetical protein
MKLEFKPVNSGWIKYNLDGSKHVDFKKSTANQLQPQPAQATTVDNGTDSSTCRRSESIEGNRQHSDLTGAVAS